MSFPRYPAYRDSGVSGLGEVPTHWSVSRLGYQCTKIGSGKTPLGGADAYSATGIIFIRSQNVHDDGIRFDDVVFITRETDAELSASRVLVGDILINITGASIGRTCLVSEGVDEANVNQHVCILRMRKAEDRAFIALFMKGYAAQRQIAQLQTGAAREGVNFAQLSNLSVVLPPSDEQRAITAFLDRETAKIDALVSEQRRLIELLKEKRQAVVSNAVTKGLNPDAPMKDSGVEWLAEVPAHWEVTRLRNVFREVAESGTDDLPILSVSIHHGVSDKEMDDEEMDRKVSRSDDRSKYKQVAPGDLVYNMMRAWQGGFGSVMVEGMVSPAYVVARPRRPIATPYVEHLLRTQQATEQMRRHSRGITDFRLRLYWDEFKNIRIALPCISESTTICEAIKTMDLEFEALSASCEQAVGVLLERRTALISAAVTGQIDVRSLATSEAA